MVQKTKEKNIPDNAFIISKSFIKKGKTIEARQTCPISIQISEILLILALKIFTELF